MIRKDRKVITLEELGRKARKCKALRGAYETARYAAASGKLKTITIDRAQKVMIEKTQ